MDWQENELEKNRNAHSIYNICNSNKGTQHYVNTKYLGILFTTKQMGFLHNRKSNYEQYAKCISCMHSSNTVSQTNFDIKR